MSDNSELIDDLRKTIEQREIERIRRPFNWRKVARWAFVIVAVVAAILVLILVLIGIFH